MPGVESVLADLVLGPRPSQESLTALCARHEIDPADARALAESLERLRVYRELVRGNLREALELSIPRSIARLGPLFDEYFDRFLLECGPRTHYLRDITPELLAFCAPLWRDDARVPSYLYDLALHESLHIEVSALPTLPRGHVSAPLALDRGVDFGAALRRVQYGYAVHELPEAETDRSVPDARRVALLVYRNPEHEVRYLELTPLADAIIARLLEGAPLGSAVTDAAEAHGVALTESVLEGAAKLLADLAERGVIRGPRPIPASGPTP